jgi:signal transduction histidine kinase
MLTAYETLETARQALRLEAREYLNKPFDIATLRRAIRTAMERRALSLQARADNQQLRNLQQEIQQQKFREELARTRGEIYASIIHDINGPLTVISGFVDLINQRIGEATHLDGEKLEIVKDRLSRVTRQVASCVQISSRYLSFLRRDPAEPATVNINQVFTDLEELLKNHRQAGKHTLIIQPLTKDVTIPINGTDLIQILLNLAINALQCSEQPHQVEIRAERLHKPLDLAQFQDGPQDRFINRERFNNTAPLLSISVNDNGPGVSASAINRIFEPYFTTKPAGQGTGLGLSIVERLIEQANGAVHLHTELGTGSTFTVYLPGEVVV